jgi:hypothetical protein
MARDPQLDQPIVAQTRSAEAGKPERQDDIRDSGGYDSANDPKDIDKSYWLACLEDAERAERPWRERGREIIQIYRNETRNYRTGKLSNGPVTFNILYANTEVMLPAVYQKPPEPVVRSRFTSVAEQPPLPPMGPLPGLGPAAPPPGLPPSPQDLGGPGPLSPGGFPPPMPPELGAAPPDLLPGPAAPLPPPELGPPTPFGALPGAPPPPMPNLPQPAPGRPPQADIETAASVMEKTLEIVVQNEQSNESIKMGIRDVLLPGRGVCRVRWTPELKSQPLPGGPLPDGTAPTEEVKIWESVGDEYVYWEDLLVDPVRARPT